MKTTIKKGLYIFTCLVFIIFSINFICNCSNIYAADTSGNNDTTGKNVNDVTPLGSNTLDETSGVIGELPHMGGSGTEGGDARYTNFNNALYKIWGVILVVLQVAAVAGVIFAGVRYMFASADSKADMKKSMIHLVIGMLIVFGATTVVGFVTGTFKEMFSTLL